VAAEEASGVSRWLEAGPPTSVPNGVGNCSWVRSSAECTCVSQVAPVAALTSSATLAPSAVAAGEEAEAAAEEEAAAAAAEEEEEEEEEEGGGWEDGWRW